MDSPFTSIRGRFDRAGIILSGLCALHCLLGIVVVSALGLGGGVLLAPEIHRVGLVAAVLVGALSFGYGAMRYRRAMPLVSGVLGLALMATAIGVGHGPGEAILTIAGVTLVAAAHLWNLRAAT